MLAKVKLQRFKKFESVEVNLQPFTVLMGENSSGKTTILQAIGLALSSLAAHNFISVDGSTVRVREKGVGLTSLPGIMLADFRELYYAKISRRGKAKGADGATIEAFDDKGNAYRLRITSLFGSFNIKCISTPAQLSSTPTLHTKPPLLISGFVGLRPQEERAFPLAIQDRLKYGQVSGVIRNLLLDTFERRRPAFDSLKHKLAKEFNFHLADISFDQEHDLHVNAHYNDLCEKKRLSLDFNASGSGFMQILQILAPIYRFCPEESSIVLLDEPDAHLHPNLQAALAKALRDIQTELGIQVIISTHSTSIIRAASPDSVVPISASSSVNGPLTTKKDVEDQITNTIDNYNLGKSIISGKLVFIEDQNTSVLEEMDRVAETFCFSGATTVPVLRGRGKDDKVPFQMKEVLGRYIGQDVEIHFLKDGDGLNDKWREETEQFADSRGVKLHQLERHEIENYLLSPELILRALIARHPQVTLPTEGDIRSRIQNTLKETVTLNRFHFEDNLEEGIYKSAILLGKGNYRNPQEVKSESRRLSAEYEKLESFEDLVRVGMGKETLHDLMGWINGDLKLALSLRDVLASLKREDIAQEIIDILKSLHSKDAKDNPENLAPVDEIGDEDTLTGDEAEESSLFSERAS